MSDTPRTDAVMTDPLRDGNDLPNLCRELERENAELKAALGSDTGDDSLFNVRRLRHMIRELETENAELRSLQTKLADSMLKRAYEMAELKAENERLRAKLESIREKHALAAVRLSSGEWRHITDADEIRSMTLQAVIWLAQPTQSEIMRVLSTMPIEGRGNVQWSSWLTPPSE